MTWTLLLSLLVKSSIIAGAGLACARFLALRPVDRADILRAAVCLLLAIPVIMNVLPALDLALLPAIAPYVPPPTYYAPLPEDVPPPPPPPPPAISGCVGYNGRWVSASGCR